MLLGVIRATIQLEGRRTAVAVPPKDEDEFWRLAWPAATDHERTARAWRDTMGGALEQKLRDDLRADDALMTVSVRHMHDYFEAKDSTYTFDFHLESSSDKLSSLAASPVLARALESATEFALTSSFRPQANEWTLRVRRLTVMVGGRQPGEMTPAVQTSDQARLAIPMFLAGVVGIMFAIFAQYTARDELVEHLKSQKDMCETISAKRIAHFEALAKESFTSALAVKMDTVHEMPPCAEAAPGSARAPTTRKVQRPQIKSCECSRQQDLDAPAAEPKTTELVNTAKTNVGR